jgi:hypothetical protein
MKRRPTTFNWEEVPSASVPSVVRGVIVALYFSLHSKAEPEDIGFDVAEVRVLAKRLVEGLDLLGEQLD